ncbi:hypothetical protein ASC90_22915 [Rhizobium sp. Root1220]|nr:hypothetical protein ASC90_22915 [Rhizobium sp. Root1220]
MKIELATDKISSRERFLEAIVQSAIDYAIISMDLDGLVTAWSLQRQCHFRKSSSATTCRRWTIEPAHVFDMPFHGATVRENPVDAEIATSWQNPVPESLADMLTCDISGEVLHHSSRFP